MSRLIRIVFDRPTETHGDCRKTIYVGPARRKLQPAVWSFTGRQPTQPR